MRFAILSFFLAFSVLAADPNSVEAWQVDRGIWELADGGIRGSGDSRAVMFGELPSDCVIEFAMTVKDGLRPRVHFMGPDFMLANEGETSQLFIHGAGAKAVRGEPYIYKKGEPMKVSAKFAGESFTITVNGQKMEGTRKACKSVRLAIQGGDGWSAGTTVYSGFSLKTSDGNSISLPDVLAPTNDPDGKVFVRSAPAQAEIFIKSGGRWVQLKATTPDTIQVPQGANSILIKKQGYRDGRLDFEVRGQNILKPAVVHLSKDNMSRIDVLIKSESDWFVYVDGKAMKDCSDEIAIASCTLLVENGEHEFTLKRSGASKEAKDALLSQKVKVAGDTTVIFAEKNSQ